MSENLFMRRALDLAELGRGTVSPNPMVGCVIVHQGRIVGEGYHMKYGQAHAEVNAVNSVENQEVLEKSTVYVTLEPCAHFGKTPPCSDLLIAKKVRKVVVACRDPFVEVDGKGIEKLRKAGIEVEVGMLEEEAQELNRRFFTFHELSRPYVVLKWAQTSDGFVARSNYDSKWISNPHSRQLVHRWRAEEDAILVGKNTAVYDNPTLNVRDWDGSDPVRILLDTNAEVANELNILNGPTKTLIFNLKKDEQKGEAHWIKLQSMNPPEVLATLYQQKIQSVIVEGGSKTLNSFIDEGCWDEARVFKADIKFGAGIPAPLVDGEIAQELTIQNDRLIIYKNNG